VISLERRSGRPLRIGHRGAAALAPENTIAAFRSAAASGVDLIEFDVLELASGELVLAHSNDLLEVSHGALRGSVRDRSLAELRAVVPELALLEDALRFFAEESPSVGAHVDVKSIGAEDRIVDALRRFGLVERSLVSAFLPGVLREASRLEPGLRTCISFPRDRLGVSNRRGSRPLVRIGLRALRPVTPAFVGRLLAHAGASALAVQHALVTPTVVRSAHVRGAAVIAWTVQTKHDLDRVARAGVDAVVVDDPRLFEVRSG
jgi:glycerophosphoryl diester phosphodiesterase